MKKLFQFVVASFIGTTLISCGGGGGDGPPTAPPTPVLTTLSVSFQTGAIVVRQSATATASGLDQNGAAISTGTVTWSTVSSAVATVSSGGLVTGVGAGATQVVADAGGKQAQATVTVNLQTVASVFVAPPTATLGVGDTRQLAATVLDANGNTITGRTVIWASSDGTKATVNATSGLVTAVAAGQATISATADGITGTSLITVNDCNNSNALQLSVGQIRTLTAAETTGLCLGVGASASEYVLIPFNSTNVATAMIELQVTGTNTSAIQPGPLAMRDARATLSGLKTPELSRSFELRFREREHNDLAGTFASFRRLTKAQRLARVRSTSDGQRNLSSSSITDLPATPIVGAIYQINANLTGNTCTSPKQLRGAKAIAVLPRTIVLSDQTSPAGGWTDEEMAAFGQAFESNGYPLSVNNFGAPSDIDTNGRVVILFTPSVNAYPALGLTAYRDILPIAECPASNEGEMFYMPVPDPNSTINNFFVDKDFLARENLSTLIHEFQHLINGGRRAYVNDAFEFETVWLNEGLSHIAEELYYYQASGNSPRQNIDLDLLRSSQAQLDAVNAGQVGNLSSLSEHLRFTESSSPFANGDDLETRGAIWQLLRYAADRTVAPDQGEWFAIVNSRESGQTNFNAVFGNIMTLSRDWVVAQFADDAGLAVAAIHTHPSWNFRSVLPAINSNVFPLVTRPLAGTPVSLTINGGGAAYLRFRVATNVPATITAASSGQPVPVAIELMLMRTQ